MPTAAFSLHEFFCFSVGYLLDVLIDSTSELLLSFCFARLNCPNSYNSLSLDVFAAPSIIPTCQAASVGMTLSGLGGGHDYTRVFFPEKVVKEQKYAFVLSEVSLLMQAVTVFAVLCKRAASVLAAILRLIGALKTGAIS